MTSHGKFASSTEGETIHARHLNLTFFEEPTDTSPEALDSAWEKIDLSGSLAEASRRVLGEVERRKIVQALKDASGNPGLAAEILHVNFRTMQTKLKDYGIS